MEVSAMNGPFAPALARSIVPSALRAASCSCQMSITGLKKSLRWCAALYFFSCFRCNQLCAAAAQALSRHQLLSLLMQEELAERRRREKQQRQRLKQKSQGMKQGAAPGKVGVGEEPSGEQRSWSFTPSLSDADGR